jgi:hypothetical protein
MEVQQALATIACMLGSPLVPLPQTAVSAAPTQLSSANIAGVECVWNLMDMGVDPHRVATVIDSAH